MEKKEAYKIYDFCSFSLINRVDQDILISTFNPEYKYFQKTEKLKNHFEIIVSNYKNQIKRSHRFLEFEKDNASWLIKKITNEKYYLLVKAKGLRSFIKYTSFKNLYVRSLLSIYLIKQQALLLHSASFSIGKVGVVLAGRPGVFKTSILMDAVRYHNAQFLGEENVILSEGLLYPFPLNIDSIAYKIKKFKNENPKNIFQKISLGLNVFIKKGRPYSNLLISEVVPVKTILYVQKGNEFALNFVNFEEIIDSLIFNEVEELSIPPTHTLSGINRNYFDKIISKLELENFKKGIIGLLLANKSNVRFGFLTVPQIYNPKITEKIISACF